MIWLPIKLKCSRKTIKLWFLKSTLSSDINPTVMDYFKLPHDVTEWRIDKNHKTRSFELLWVGFGIVLILVRKGQNYSTLHMIIKEQTGNHNNEKCESSKYHSKQ